MTPYIIARFFLAIAAAGILALAQTITGNISGVVTDSSGLSVAGATVRLTRTATGITRDFQTPASGDFSFNAVEPGAYEVTAVPGRVLQRIQSHAVQQCGFHSAVGCSQQADHNQHVRPGERGADAPSDPACTALQLLAEDRPVTL